MKRVLGSRKRYDRKSVGVFLIAIALIAGMVGCDPTPGSNELHISSTAGGSITTPGAGIFTYPTGTVVNLVAEAEEGYGFTGWTGNVSTIADVNAATTTITMNGNYSIRANFARQYTLAISSTGGGSLTTPGTGIFTYPAGTVVNLVAEAEEDYQFLGWTRHVDTVADVNAATTTITMNDNYSIRANFVRQRTLTISSSQGGNVTTPGEGTFTYADHTVVDLVAEADDGYQFVSWTGSRIADARAATTTLVMDHDYSITANFAVPTLVQNWHDLNAARNNLRGIYILMNDLNSSSPGYEELASPAADGGKGWQPIGSFAGTFDGGGHSISDLFINRPDEYGVALFRSVPKGGGIMNLGVVNATVTGDYSVAALAGYVDDTVTNCYSVSSVNGTAPVGGLIAHNDGTVTNCYSVSSVNSWGYTTAQDGVGGLIGENHGTVNNCSATGSASSSNDYVGGLIGENRGTVSNSYSSGNVTGKYNVGGLVGNNRGTLSDSYSTGSVTGVTYTGGLIGRNGRSIKVTSCYSTGRVTGVGYTGGLIGENSYSIVTSCYSTGRVTGEFFVGGLVGRNPLGTVKGSFWDTETSGQATSDGGTGKTTTEMQDITTFSGTGWNIIAVADPGTRNSSYIWNILNGVTYPFLSWQP